MSKRFPSQAAVLLIITVAAYGIGNATAFPSRSSSSADDLAPQAPPAFRVDSPPNRALDANLYMQTSAEYHACCLQAYNLADRLLREQLEAAKKNPGKTLAVICDLDETVLDNAGFQAMMLRSGLAFDERLWDSWEKTYWKQVGILPGAKEFILNAEKQGVVVVHISNRTEANREQTKSALERLGIPIHKEDQLLLNKSKTSSDKTERRAQVAVNHSVVLLLGDNLRDFDEKFKCPPLGTRKPEELEEAIRLRKVAVDADRQLWGTRYVIIPNPAYGEWTKPLGSGMQDLDRLVKQMKPE